MARTARPMIELTGTMADVRVGDYVDEIGDGVRYARIAVAALLHKIEPRYQVTLGGVREVTAFEFLGKGTHGVKLDAPVRFRRFADVEG